MKKLLSALLVLFLVSPAFVSSTDAFSKGEIKKEIENKGKEGEGLMVVIVQVSLYIGFGVSVIALILPSTRRYGFQLLIGVILALGAIVMFTDVFTSPLQDLHEKKTMKDFFKSGN